MCIRVKDSKKILTDRNLRKRRVSASEIDIRGCQAHGRSEIREIDFELEIANIEFAVTVRKISTDQEGNWSGNTHEFVGYYETF